MSFLRKHSLSIFMAILFVAFISLDFYFSVQHEKSEAETHKQEFVWEDHNNRFLSEAFSEWQGEAALLLVVILARKKLVEVGTDE